jgi:hypothetical protein
MIERGGQVKISLSGVRLGNGRHYEGSRMLEAGESGTVTSAPLGNSARARLASDAHDIPATDGKAGDLMGSLLDG